MQNSLEAAIDRGGGFPQAENGQGQGNPLINYLDRQIRYFNNPALLIDSTEKAKEIQRYEAMKGQVTRGEFSTDFQAEFRKSQTKLEAFKKQVVPRSQDPSVDAMPGDTIYFHCKEGIMHEQRILAKAAAVLDQDDKAYIAGKIEAYRSRQKVTTRGVLMEEINSQQQLVNALRRLQQPLPQSRAPVVK